MYRYVFPNGKSYVGATKRRLVQRQGRNFRCYQGCKPLWAAIQEYGIESIKQEVLFEGTCDSAAIASLEREYIEAFDSANPEHGYNVNRGGGGFVKNLSEERKELLKTQMREFGKRHVGIHPTEDTRMKQSLAKVGKTREPLSEETKAKIGFANSRENMSDETRERRSKSKMRKILVKNVLDGREKIFDSQNDVADYFGVKASSVSRWLGGTRPVPKNYMVKRYSPATTE